MSSSVFNRSVTPADSAPNWASSSWGASQVIFGFSPILIYLCVTYQIAMVIPILTSNFILLSMDIYMAGAKFLTEVLMNCPYRIDPNDCNRGIDLDCVLRLTQNCLEQLSKKPLLGGGGQSGGGRRSQPPTNAIVAHLLLHRIASVTPQTTVPKGLLQDVHKSEFSVPTPIGSYAPAVNSELQKIPVTFLNRAINTPLEHEIGVLFGLYLVTRGLPAYVLPNVRLVSEIRKVYPEMTIFGNYVTSGSRSIPSINATDVVRYTLQKGSKLYQFTIPRELVDLDMLKKSASDLNITFSK